MVGVVVMLVGQVVGGVGGFGEDMGSIDGGMVGSEEIGYGSEMCYVQWCVLFMWGSGVYYWEVFWIVWWVIFLVVFLNGCKYVSVQMKYSVVSVILIQVSSIEVWILLLVVCISFFVRYIRISMDDYCSVQMLCFKILCSGSSKGMILSIIYELFGCSGVSISFYVRQSRIRVIRLELVLRWKQCVLLFMMVFVI